MNPFEATGEIMASGDDKWGKDGPNPGCLVSLTKVGAGAVVLAITAFVAYTVLAPALVDLWW